MNDKNSEKITVEQLILQFATSPQEAYTNLIKSRVYIDPRLAHSFWTAFKGLNIESLLIKFPKSSDVYARTIKLHLFWDLLKIYRENIKDCKKRLIKINPTQEALIKSLLLAIELGHTIPGDDSLPNYSFDGLEVLKSILKDIVPQLKDKNSKSYSLELFNLTKHLLMLKIDLKLLYEFIDVYEWAGFDIEKAENNKGYHLVFTEAKETDKNLYWLNKAKVHIKWEQYKKESHENIGKEKHFKKVDPIFKTNEGLATAIYGKGITSISQSQGTTSLQVDDEMLKNLISTDQKQRDEATISLLHLMLIQSFHHHFRQAMSNIYVPNEGIDIHTFYVKTGHARQASLYELFCVASCFTAMADAFRYVHLLPGTGGIRNIKQMLMDHLQFNDPEKGNELISNEANSIIATNFNDIEKIEKPFDILSREAILRYFRRIEELKDKPDEELFAMIDFFATEKEAIPVNPVYLVDEGYLFPYQTCYTCDLNRLVYDYYITQNLFNSRDSIKGSLKAKQIGNNHQVREQKFNSAVKEILSTLTPYTASEIKFGKNSGYNFEALEGDIDVIAYFKDDNILMPIQVKLSNTSIIKEKGKAAWVQSQIKESAVKQVAKDAKLLSLESGRKFIAEKLKLSFTPEFTKASVYPLIITDNFYVDHQSFQYSQGGDLVRCISFFELKHLITNTRIHEKQTNWNSFRENGSVAELFAMIEHNAFWSFLHAIPPNEIESKGLKVINEENRIHFRYY